MSLNEDCSNLLLTKLLGEFYVGVRGIGSIVPAQGLFIEKAEIVSCYRSLFQVSDTGEDPVLSWIAHSLASRYSLSALALFRFSSFDPKTNVTFPDLA